MASVDALGLEDPFLRAVAPKCPAWNECASDVSSDSLLINSQKLLQTSVTSFNYWMLRRTPLSPGTSWTQSSDSLLTWILDFAENLACSQGWCFSFKALFQLHGSLIYKYCFETCRLLQIHTVDVVLNPEILMQEVSGKWLPKWYVQNESWKGPLPALVGKMKNWL